MCEAMNYAIGSVDWFGGENNKKGKANEFGFITSHNNKSVFVHKNDLVEGLPKENDIVFFNILKNTKGQYSAKQVVVISEDYKELTLVMKSLFASSEETNYIQWSLKCKKFISDIFESHLGVEIIKKLKGENEIFSALLSVITDLSNSVNLLSELTDSLSINEIYNKSIKASDFPNCFFVNRYNDILNWWGSFKSRELKYNLLCEAVKFLSLPNDLYKELEEGLSEGVILSTLTMLKAEFGLMPNIGFMLSSKAENIMFIEHYVSGVEIEGFVDKGFPLEYIPNELSTRLAIKKIKEIDCNGSYECFNKSFLSIISKLELIDYILKNNSPETVVSFVKYYAIEFPFDSSFLHLINKTDKYFELFDIYSQGISLEQYLQNGIYKNISSYYIKMQLNEHFLSLMLPKYDTPKRASEIIIKFSLESKAFRSFSIEELSKIHPTHYSDIVDFLIDTDDVLIAKIKTCILDRENSELDIQYLVPLLAIDDSNFTRHFINKNFNVLVAWLASLNEDESLLYLNEHIDYFDTSLLLSLIFKGLIPIECIGDRAGEIDLFLYNIFKKLDTGVEPYVREVYKQSFSNFNDFKNNEVIKHFYEINMIKFKINNIRYKIYHKDMSFVNDVESIPALRSDPEYWLLSKLLPLIIPENSYEVISTVILHEIWIALINGDLDVDHPSIFKLFPQCNTMKKNFPHIQLSCEAFFWKKDELSQENNNDMIFLCRSRRCKFPKILPNTNKALELFSIFDWLSFYGVNYLSVIGPSRNDFPIKLAGYFNRIRELRSHLNCRECGKIMAPNMKYARVEVVKLDPFTGNKVNVSVNAAYRLTVFKCNHIECTEYNIDYYINHCIGHKCYKIIDGRDLLEKCDEDRYICGDAECRSCCIKHSSTSSFPQDYNLTEKHKNLYGRLSDNS